VSEGEKGENGERGEKVREARYGMATLRNSFHENTVSNGETPRGVITARLVVS